jgi:hypothetical protein
MRKLNTLILAIFILLNSCDCSKNSTPKLFNFTLSQPDGTVPENGYAIIYEKHLDPTTGISTINLPISDTLHWVSENQVGKIEWVDTRLDYNKSISIECYSPDNYTSDSERKPWINIESEAIEYSLTFSQSRPVEINIRHSEPTPTIAKGWGIIITPDKTHILDDLTSFNDIKEVHMNRVRLTSHVLFTEHSIMYCHLYRHDGVTWHESGMYSLDILIENDGFFFNSEHTMSCCD